MRIQIIESLDNTYWKKAVGTMLLNNRVLQKKILCNNYPLHWISYLNALSLDEMIRPSMVITMPAISCLQYIILGSKCDRSNSTREENGMVDRSLMLPWCLQGCVSVCVCVSVPLMVFATPATHCFERS